MILSYFHTCNITLNFFYIYYDTIDIWWFILLYLLYLFKDLCEFDSLVIVLLFLCTYPYVILFVTSVISFVKVVTFRVLVYLSTHLRWFVNYFWIVVKKSLRKFFVFSSSVKDCLRPSCHNGTVISISMMVFYFVLKS